MNIFRYIAQLPKPLKTLCVLFIAVFIVGIIPVLLRVPEASGWMSGGLGVASLLLGLCLVTSLKLYGHPARPPSEGGRSSVDLRQMDTQVLASRAGRARQAYLRLPCSPA